MGAKAKRLTREERLRKAGFRETTVQEFLDPLARALGVHPKDLIVKKMK